MNYKREVIASYPGKCLIVRLSADKKGALSFRVNIGRGYAPWENVPFKKQVVRKQNYNKFVDDIKFADDHLQVMTATVGGRDPVIASLAVKTITSGESNKKNHTEQRNA